MVVVKANLALEEVELQAQLTPEAVEAVEPTIIPLEAAELEALVL